MKLAIITALHQRYRLTRLFLDYYQRMDVEGVDLGLFCACTEGDYDMQHVATSFPSWKVSTAENMPLVPKFAANMPKARQWGADAVMILGSDDFVSARYIERAAERVLKHGFVGNMIVHYIDMGTDQMIMQWDMGGRPIGAGRAIAAPVLDAVDWYPWLDDDTIGLDRSMLLRLGEVNPCVLMHQHGLLDCKDGVNQTPYKTVRSWPHEEVDSCLYLSEHFPSIKNTLLNW